MRGKDINKTKIVIGCDINKKGNKHIRGKNTKKKKNTFVHVLRCFC